MKQSMKNLEASLLSNIGLAQRARKIISGESLMNSIRSQKVSFVIVATDASDRTKKQYTTKCAYYNIEMKILFTIDQLSKAIGKHNRVAIGIADSQFAKMIIEAIEEEY